MVNRAVILLTWGHSCESKYKILIKLEVDKNVTITLTIIVTYRSNSVDGSNKVGVGNGCIASLDGPHWLTEDR